MLKKGTHEKHKSVHKNKATKINFKCDYDLVCSIDGEIAIGNKFDIKLIEKALMVYNNKELIKEFLK